MFHQFRGNEGFCLDMIPACLSGYSREHMAKRYALSLREPKSPACDKYLPRIRQ